MDPVDIPATASPPLLRNTWISVFGDAFRLAVLLAILASAVRGMGMLGPPRCFWVLPVGFTLMALTPWLFFRREGRRRAASTAQQPRPRVWSTERSRGI